MNSPLSSILGIDFRLAFVASILFFSFADFAISDDGDDWLIEADLLKGWISGARSPALVTTSADNTPRNEAGVLSNSTTQVLFGDQRIQSEDRTGARFRLAQKLANEGDIGIYAAGLYLADGDKDSLFASNQSGLPILGRPFFNSNTQLSDAQLVSYPNVLVGQVGVSTGSEAYLGDIGLSTAFIHDKEIELDLHVGYRFISFRDALYVREDLRSIDAGGFIPLDTTFVVQDSFAAQNQFHGGSFGLSLLKRAEYWSYGIQSNVSLGGLNRTLRTRGSTDVTIPGLPTDNYAGGLFALPTNIENYKSAKFVAVPEIRLHANRNITSKLSLNFGYNVLLLPQTWRAAEQVDFTVNESQIGGGTLSGLSRPEFRGASSDIWIQTLSLGVGYRW